MGLPQVVRPRFAKSLAPVRSGTEPFGCHRRLLGSVGKELIATVPALEHGLRRICAYTMRNQGQFAVVNVETRMVVVLEIVEYLVGRGKHHFYRTV